MSEQGSLGEEESNLLQAALTTAFTAAAVAQASPETPKSSSAFENASSSEPESSLEASSTSESNTDSDSWKAEYEANVKSWRRQSAHMRDKAEKERERWERIREEEKARRLAEGVPAVEQSESGWESLGEGQSVAAQSDVRPLDSSPSPADVRDLVTGEPQRKQPSHDLTEGSQKWEDVPSSLTSSFPSMSFPETPGSDPFRTTPTAPSKAGEHGQPTLSATTAVFDQTLSRRSRVSALLSSLAINLLLPFVNGVMLGFGELFAKNVVLGWFGWTAAGATAANVGLGAQRRRR